MTTSSALKRVLPSGLKRILRELLGLTALQARMDQLETLIYKSKDEIWERSRRRWRDADPTSDLTWGEPTTGDAFVTKAESHHAFEPDKAILEIGPGYGRLLRSIVKRSIRFKYYLGVDISAKNIAYLGKDLAGPNIEFVEGDIESIKLSKGFDVVISSLVLKHLFPSFRKALENVARFLNPRALLVFDLIEGKRTFFEKDDVTYVRQYSREEVLEILEQTGFTLVVFDEVRHEHDQVRLLVIARKR